MNNIARTKTTVTSDEIKELRDERLGRWLTGTVAIVGRLERIDTWCTGLDHPDEAQAHRLAVALELLRSVAEAENSRDTARAWFIGANVELGNELVSPAEAIRTNHFNEARASAQRLIHDAPFSA